MSLNSDLHVAVIGGCGTAAPYAKAEARCCA
jgi:hypothetical protein